MSTVWYDAAEYEGSQTSLCAARLASFCAVGRSHAAEVRSLVNCNRVCQARASKRRSVRSQPSSRGRVNANARSNEKKKNSDAACSLGLQAGS